MRKIYSMKMPTALQCTGNSYVVIWIQLMPACQIPTKHEMSSLCFQDFGLGVASSPRCDLKRNLVAAGCSPSSVESPTSKLQVMEDRPLSNKATVATQDITQIKPQRLHINLRPGGFAHLLPGVWF